MKRIIYFDRIRWIHAKSLILSISQKTKLMISLDQQKDRTSTHICFSNFFINGLASQATHYIL
jgi:hypothetical protein